LRLDTKLEAPAAKPEAPPTRHLDVGRGYFGIALPWVLLVAGLCLPLVFSTGFELSRYQILLTYMTVAIALNFAFGFAGELALSQPVLIAVAAYTAGLLSAYKNWDVWQTVLPGILAAIVASILLALPSLRVRGWYFAIISFFAIAVMPDVITAFAPITGGDSGLLGINPMRVGTFIFPAWLAYEAVLATTVLTWIGVRNLVDSGWGVVIRAMRDHPVAARATGVNLHVTRAWVHVLLAVPCGLVGVEFAHTQLFLSPSNFAFTMILLLIGGVFLGGPGTLWGPVLGISVFQGISFWIGPFSAYNSLFLGAGVLISALGFKGGMVATLERVYDRIARRRGGARASPVSEDGVRFEDASVRLEPIQSGDVGLSVAGVSKRFGGNQALRDVSLELRGGELLALIGPNGSGKTTLLNLVNGFVKADAGSITLNGHEYRHLPPAQTARHGLGRTFQVPRLIDELTVAKNVQLGLLGLGRQRVLASLVRWPFLRRRERADLERAREVCRFLGLPPAVIDVHAGALPLGLKRIVEIGRAVVAGSRVICLDEPAAGLNETERERLKGVLRALVQAGRAVLLVEHNTRFVLDVCDRIVLLKDGEIVGRGDGGRKGEMDEQLREYVAAYTV
jgi:branched-chain amino acid transport system ATP-binding protein/branched-chain amino acid transport system permease protein